MMVKEDQGFKISNRTFKCYLFFEHGLQVKYIADRSGDNFIGLDPVLIYV